MANMLQLFVRIRNTATSTARDVEQWLDQLKADLHNLYFDM